MSGPIAAIGHMPFKGHRTVAQVDAQLGASPRFCTECNRSVSRLGAEQCRNMFCKAA